MKAAVALALAAAVAVAAVTGLALVPVVAVGGPTGQPPGLAPASAAAPRSPGATAALAFALGQLGRPYLWGGSGPGGWDCSGLVQAAYGAAGVRLAHDAAAQYAATAVSAVPLDALAPGDLVFFGASPATIHHVGIAVDASHMVDAPHTGAVVRVEDLHWPDLLAATRPLPPGL